MASISVKSRSKGVKSFEATFASSLAATKVSELKAQIKKTTKLDETRQRLTTVDKKVLSDTDKTLEDYGVKEGDEVLLKDLGFQISWRTVFLTEYFGPLLIHPIFYFSNPVSDILYGGAVPHSQMQKLAFGMVMAHYAKRELETVLVHRFSNSTMPWFNIIKNSAHYWILSGLLIAPPIYSPSSSVAAVRNTIFSNTNFLYSVVAVWAFAEVSNLFTHLTLRSLRPAGTRTRAIPYGYGFNQVACPNYTFEILGWVAFTVLTGNWAAALFAAVSAGVMTKWAKGKQRNYKKEFGAKWPKGRKAIFPWVY